ncbi:MAG: hypothetical protein RR828_06130, partial [Oscillospiraceae bacterium]
MNCSKYVVKCTFSTFVEITEISIALISAISSFKLIHCKKKEPGLHPALLYFMLFFAGHQFCQHCAHVLAL